MFSFWGDNQTNDNFQRSFSFKASGKKVAAADVHVNAPICTIPENHAMIWSVSNMKFHIAHINNTNNTPQMLTQ